MPQHNTTSTCGGRGGGNPANTRGGDAGKIQFHRRSEAIFKSARPAGDRGSDGNSKVNVCAHPREHLLS